MSDTPWRVSCDGSDVTVIDADGQAFVTPKPDQRFFLARLDSSDVPWEAELLPGFFANMIRNKLIGHEDVDGLMKLKLQVAAMNSIEWSDQEVEQWNQERRERLRMAN